MSTLHVSFTNNSTQPDASVSIGFVPGSSTAAFTITNTADGSALLPLDPAPPTANWYSLPQLAQGVDIASFSGRIYVAYGPTWQPLVLSGNPPTSTPAAANYEPGQTPADLNFYLRYDKMEITFTGQTTDVANLTSIDYWSIPISLQTSHKGAAIGSVQGLIGDTTAQDIYTALNALTSTPVSGLPGIPNGVDSTPLPALVPGQYQAYPAAGWPSPGPAFARIIGPSSYPPINPISIPVTPYSTWQAYLQNLLTQFGPGTKAGATIPTLGNGVIATIAGQFAGVGPNVPATGPQSAQAYNLTATIDANLDITLTGTIGSVSGTTTVLYKAADLMNPSGLYGGNTPYYLNGASTPTTPGNDIYGWLGGDLASGFNIGAVGSALSVTVGGTTTPAGALPSQQWFGLSPSLFFATMQPDNPFYNAWAAALAPLSQAYNFAFSDRFAPVFASLDPAKVDTLDLILEPDPFGTFVTVQSTQPWQSTGVTVAAGQPVTITYLDGLWTSNPNDNNGQLFDANGNPAYVANQPGYTMLGQNEGSLIGQVGSNPVFYVGDGPTTTPAGQTGLLQLCINDDLQGRYGPGLKDNQGSVTVFIS